MHAAQLETSERLQRVAKLLGDGQWHSTRNIIQRANVCAVNSTISELRRNGLDIECRCLVGKRRVWWYMLKREP